MSVVRVAIANVANAAYPREACGFVLHDGTVIECANRAEDPYNSFVVDPGEVAAWWETDQVRALWHSHPADPAVPSGDDEALWVDAGLDWAYLVYSVPDEDLGWYELKDDRLHLTTMETSDA